MSEMSAEIIEEDWKHIPEFPNYMISSLGRVYNIARDHIMSVSTTNHGHPKITLVGEDGERHTRSVALLVADAFVPDRDILSDQVIVLDGDLNHIDAFNLAWRPRWFAWQYTRQLKCTQPLHYRNLPVVNIVDKIDYDSVIHAGTSEGLLFTAVWRSTYTGHAVYPTDSIFEVSERV